MPCNKSFVGVLALMLGACGIIPNGHDPENINPMTLPKDMGIMLISSGAPESCTSFSTFLNLQSAGSEIDENVLYSIPVDVSAIKSDFQDHHGFLNATALKAGAYQLYPIIANPNVKSIKIPKAEFSVAAGEVVYLGEYYMPVSCVLNPVTEFRDSEQRDISLLKIKNPEFSNMPITKRLGTFSGCLKGCNK